jgi:hypothetical protein
MVINAKDRFAELPEKEKLAIRKRADELYAEVTGGASRKFQAPRKAAPNPRKKAAK